MSQKTQVTTSDQRDLSKIDLLQGRLRKYKDELKKAGAKIKELEEKLKILTEKMYGCSSEKMRPEDNKFNDKATNIIIKPGKKASHHAI